VIERFHRVDHDHIELEVTMQDPKALAKPWVGKLYYELRNDWELGKITCGRRSGLQQIREFQLSEKGHS
jgi:hypothetical protein